MPIETILFNRRGIDRLSDRMLTVSAYSGEFKAQFISALYTSSFPTRYSADGDSSSRLFYLLKGFAMIKVENRSPYNLFYDSVKQRRPQLILPPEVGYDVEIASDSILISSLEQGGKKNMYGAEPIENAKVRTLFQNRQAGFSTSQLQFMMPFQEKVILDSYSYPHGRLYSMLQGEATLRLEHSVTKDRIEERIKPHDIDYLSVPPHTACGVKADAHSIVVCCSSEVPRLESSISYRNDWLLFKE